MKRLVDTNVLEVANDTAAESHGLDCIEACVDLLVDIQARGHLLLDDDFAILREYMDHANERGQPGVGDAFLRWAKTNEYNAALCTRVPVPLDDDRGYEAFPDDEALADFDRSDRKFVAVALTHGGRPPIYNATDSDWAHHAGPLRDAGLRIEELCS